MQIWETSSLQPTGTARAGRTSKPYIRIPMLAPNPNHIPGLAVQISKNWHTSSPDRQTTYWAGFEGLWWTANLLLRLPPNSSIALSLALSYEMYGGVPAWSRDHIDHIHWP